MPEYKGASWSEEPRSSSPMTDPCNVLKCSLCEYRTHAFWGTSVDTDAIGNMKRHITMKHGKLRADDGHSLKYEQPLEVITRSTNLYHGVEYEYGRIRYAGRQRNIYKCLKCGEKFWKYWRIRKHIDEGCVPMGTTAKEGGGSMTVNILAKKTIVRNENVVLDLDMIGLLDKIKEKLEGRDVARLRDSKGYALQLLSQINVGRFVNVR